MDHEKYPLIIVAGPTAVGKSACAVRLAHRIGGEIISADSVQVYRGMDIGSAKVSDEEMEGIPHHMIDILDPEDPFDVTIFSEKARACVPEICERGHIPILTGGTGFYIQALLYTIDFKPHSCDPACRQRLEQIAAGENGAEKLHAMLREKDPDAAMAIPRQNVRRVIRALEYYHLTGEKISVHNREQHRREAAYEHVYFVLTDRREKIYERINARVDAMIADGLVQEVQRLKERGLTRQHSSMKALGYKEILAYLDGECSLEEAAEKIKLETRHFAKRQLTWFRREKDVIWIDRSTFPDEDAMLACMCEHIRWNASQSCESVRKGSCKF